MADFWESVTNSLSRRIDNELNSDFLPSPSQPGAGAGQAQVVKTSNDELGKPILAGTGASTPNGVPTYVWIGGGVLLTGILIIAAIK